MNNKYDIRPLLNEVLIRNQFEDDGLGWKYEVYKGKRTYYLRAYHLGDLGRRLDIRVVDGLTDYVGQSDAYLRNMTGLYEGEIEGSIKNKVFPISVFYVELPTR
jgi:hypothetical protein